MNMLHYFVVKLDKLLQDEIKLGDQNIYMETKFNEFEHRVCQGEVVSVPKKYDTPVKVGDTLYFHHLVVINGGMPFADREGEYLVSYDPDVTINCHAFAYTPKGEDDVIPLSMWSILRPHQEEIVDRTQLWTEVRLKDADPDRGVLAYRTYMHKDLGIEEGDVVVFPSKLRYDFKVNDETMYRVRTEDLLYVQKAIHHD
jgi:hypothetical protein